MFQILTFQILYENTYQYWNRFWLTLYFFIYWKADKMDYVMHFVSLNFESLANEYPYFEKW